MLYWGQNINQLISLNCFFGREWAERRIQVWSNGKHRGESKRDGSGRLEVEILGLDIDLASAFDRVLIALAVAGEVTLKAISFMWTS